MELFIREPRYYECPLGIYIPVPIRTDITIKNFFQKPGYTEGKSGTLGVSCRITRMRLYGNSTPKNPSPPNITNALVP